MEKKQKNHSLESKLGKVTGYICKFLKTFLNIKIEKSKIAEKEKTMTPDNKKPQLDLNQENLKKGLLQYNYFPFTHDQKEEMPPIFNSESLTIEIANKIKNIGLSVNRRKNGFDVLPFKRTRHPNIPRVLGIPHPKAYVDLVHTIIENWEDHLQCACQSESSNLKFEVQPDFRIIVHKYNSIAIDAGEESKDPSLDFGSSYRVKTDITNFYHSIYSHSLPWALVGHSEAKKKRSGEDWFNNIDKCARMSQRNETKGITIGPATSSILSEIVLFPVDKALREKGYKFSRYIDDYTAFTESKSLADEFLIDLAKQLEKYALSLNPKKTTITQMPIQNTEKWVIEMNQVLALANPKFYDEKNENENESSLKYRQIRLIIDKAISIGSDYPDGSAIKYAFASIIEAGVSGEDAETHLQDTLLKYSFYYPALVPLIYRWINNSNINFDIHDRIMHIFRHSLSQGQSDNAVWCIYYLFACAHGTKETSILSAACKDEAPMVMLMAYVYAKKNNLPLKEIADWSTGKIEDLKAGRIEEYDIDRYWILFYQLFLDGIIKEAPYIAQEDNKVFNILKANGVSFVNYEHEDLINPIQRIFGRLIPF